MCGRFALPMEPTEVENRFHEEKIPLNELHGNELATSHRFNIAPTCNAPVYFFTSDNNGGKYSLQYMRWGVVPMWVRTMEDVKKSRMSTFNAKYENLDTGKVWKSCKRCLVPVQGYYEWHKDKAKKVPYYITRKDQKLTFFAGLYNVHEVDNKVFYSFTIITWKAPKLLDWLHHRMPIVMEPGSSKCDKWLKNEDAYTNLLDLYSGDLLEWYKVDPMVGNSRNDDSKFIEPLKQPQGIDNFFSKNYSNVKKDAAAEGPTVKDNLNAKKDEESNVNIEPAIKKEQMDEDLKSEKISKVKLETEGKDEMEEAKKEPHVKEKRLTEEANGESAGDKRKGADRRRHSKKRKI